MWNGRDGGDPRSSRGGRDARGGGRGAPGGAGASGRYPNQPPISRSPNAPNPYRPYGESTNARMPVPYTPTGQVPSIYDPRLYGLAATPLPADHRHRLGIAIFHDGNPGHLWRGSVASQLAEAILGAGVVMWLAALVDSPLAIALAVAAMGLPFLLVGPLAAPLENVEEPRGGLRVLGWLRILLAVGLIGMHFRTILPVVYLLLFGISLCGRLHDALRTAAIRTCLGPGEPESIANDLHVGAALAAVMGPLIATLAYILNGERILALGVVSAVIFLISVNSEAFLDALPSNRRAFLLATPESVSHNDSADGDAEWDDEDAAGEDDEEYDDPADRREMRLPEWYQQGPTGAGQAFGDIRVGLGLAGTNSASTAALWGRSAIALVGGGLAVLEVFYVINALLLPSFYLGPLLATEGAGAALGVLIARPFADRAWRAAFITGLIGSGVALAGLGRVLQPLVVVGLTCALGLMNALAVAGAHRALTYRFTPLERRALAAAENWATALCGVAGTLILVAFYEGAYISTGPNLKLHLPTWHIAPLISMLGFGLVAVAILSIVLMSFNISLPKPTLGKSGKSSSGTKGRVPGSLPSADDNASDYLPALDGDDEWDDEGSGDYDDYDGTGYRSAQYPASDYDDDDDFGRPPARSSRQPKGRQPRSHR